MGEKRAGAEGKMMFYKILLTLLAMNLAVGSACADDLERYLDKLSRAQVGAENANMMPVEESMRDSAERLAGRLGSKLFKGVRGGAAEDGRPALSLGELLRESEYDVQFSEDDVLFNMTYHF